MWNQTQRGHGQGWPLPTARGRGPHAPCSQLPVSGGDRWGNRFVGWVFGSTLGASHQSQGALSRNPSACRAPTVETASVSNIGRTWSAAQAQARAGLASPPALSRRRRRRFPSPLRGKCWKAASTIGTPSGPTDRLRPNVRCAPRPAPVQSHSVASSLSASSLNCGSCRMRHGSSAWQSRSQYNSRWPVFDKPVIIGRSCGRRWRARSVKPGCRPRAWR